jgi:hypothetical protein
MPYLNCGVEASASSRSWRDRKVAVVSLSESYGRQSNDGLSPLRLAHCRVDLERSGSWYVKAVGISTTVRSWRITARPPAA